MALERRRGYRPDHKSFGRFMVSDQAQDPAVKVAEDIAQIAEATHRRSAGPGPHMADQYQVVKPTAPISYGGNPRAYADVINTDPQAPAEEFGGKFQQPQRTLGKAGAPFHSPKGGE